MNKELEEFEKKINGITEQFMSLLNSNDTISDSVENKNESAYDAAHEGEISGISSQGETNCGGQIYNTTHEGTAYSTPTHSETTYNTVCEGVTYDNAVHTGITCSNTNGDVSTNNGTINNETTYNGPVNNDIPHNNTENNGTTHNGITYDGAIYNPTTNGGNGYNGAQCGTVNNGSTSGAVYGNSTFTLGSDNIKIGGISYEDSNSAYNGLPKHAIKFNSAEHANLNSKLEGLYNDKKQASANYYNPNQTIAYSGSEGINANNLGSNGSHIDYTNEKTNSTLNNKEGYKMSEYNGEEKKDNVFYSFATIPTEKSLVEKRNWKEVLFADIPWDTKIDVWGGIKKFCTAQIKITF